MTGTKLTEAETMVDEIRAAAEMAAARAAGGAGEAS